MKAVQLHGYGGVDRLRYEDVSEPKPKADEVLVKVSATSVNPVDWKIRQGQMKERMPVQFPAILGSDAAGEVVAAGDQVTNLKRGDKVLGMVQHGYAEFIAAKASVFALIPANLDLQRAGVIPLVTLTGTQLIEKGVKPKKGEIVLITGALGSVGRTAVYVAKQHGAYVIAGVRAKQKKEAEALNADQIVALDDDQELNSLQELDAVGDAVNGETAEKLVSKLKKSGVFASVLGKPSNLEAAGIRFEQVFAQPDAVRLQQLAQDIQDGKFDMPIAERFKLSEIQQAHQSGEKGVSGKILLLP